MGKTTRPPRTCDNCGRTYLRRNLSEGWTGQNPGHRVGWQKSVVKLCTSCQPAELTTRTMTLIASRVVPHNGHKSKSSKSDK